MKRKVIICSIIILTNFITAFVAILATSLYINLCYLGRTFEHNIKECEEINLIVNAIISNIQLDPSETIMKLELFRNNTPVTYEGINVRKELIRSGLITSDSIEKNE